MPDYWRGHVCGGSTGNGYSGPSGLGLTYGWGISGSGTIQGSTSSQAVSVNAGASGSFQLNLTVTGSSCSNTCNKIVTIGNTTTITSQPVSQTVTSGATAVFQWRADCDRVTSDNAVRPLPSAAARARRTSLKAPADWLRAEVLVHPPCLHIGSIETLLIDAA